MKGAGFAIVLAASLFGGYSAAAEPDPAFRGGPFQSTRFRVPLPPPSPRTIYSAPAEPAAAEPVLICDSLCWFKTSFAKNESELHQLWCKRVMRTDQEGIGWQDAISGGDLAVGKLATIQSSDLQPYPGASSCEESQGSRGVRVSGFAYRVKVCGLSHGTLEAGKLLVIQTCGEKPNGNTVIFFPLPPL